MASSNGTPSANGHEKHAWQFRDQKFPARILHLLVDQKITATDLILIAVIDSLIKPQTYEPGMGCWATNAYLGKAAKVIPTYVSQRINYLAGMGLLLIVYYQDRRYLEVEWSRTAEERGALEGEYGKLLREAHDRLVERLRQTEGGVTEKPKEGDKGKPQPPLRENPKQNRSVEEELSIELSKQGCSQASNRLNGTLVHNTLNGNPPQKPDRAMSQAKKLIKILRKKNKLVGGPPNIKAWTVQFRKLGLSRSAKEINSALDWYEEHFGEDYVPQAYSACAFVDKFLKIEAAIERGKRRFTTDENGYQRRVPKGDEDLYMKPGEEW